ncbi:MAG: hypothetical protein K0Q58_1262 [Microbacterium sp.]|nr:hypothetical protein [Microbacterium sp.]
MAKISADSAPHDAEHTSAASQREKARVGMAAGDERYLQPRDKGPQRRFVRDLVDSGWHVAELIMPVMVVVLLLMFVNIPFLLGWYGAMRTVQMRFMRLPKPQVKRGQRPS